MHLYSGAKYWPFEPKAEEVDLMDIAHSLASKARYNGHTKFPIWVAQHSVYTAICNIEGHNSYQDRLERLMHDASEYVVGDLIRPLKYSPSFAAPFKEVEDLNEAVIADALALAHPHKPHVKIADEMVTTAEVRQLINKKEGLVFDKPLHDESKCADIVIEEWTWRQARFAFVSLAVALDKGRTDPDLRKQQITFEYVNILERLNVPSEEILRSMK